MITTLAHPSSNDAFHALREAARAGDVAGIRQWLPEVSVASYRRMALYEAASHNQMEAVIALLDGGVNFWESHDDSLVAAAKNGHVDMARLLIARGADIHANNDKALQTAAIIGHINVVQVLIEAGADIDRSEALGSAAEWGNIEIVKLLIERGADCNYPNDNPPLNGARRRDQTEVTRLLLKHGAQVTPDAAFVDLAIHDGQAELVSLYLDHGLPINDPQHPLLTMAITTDGNEAVCRMLLSRGADPCANNWDTFGTLDAFSAATHLQRADLLQMFIEHGADINRTPASTMESALRNGAPEVVMVFLTHWTGRQQILDVIAKHPNAKNSSLIHAQILRWQIESTLDACRGEAPEASPSAAGGGEIRPLMYEITHP